MLRAVAGTGWRGVGDAGAVPDIAEAKLKASHNETKIGTSARCIV